MSTRGRINPFEEVTRMFERLSNQFNEVSRSWAEDDRFDGWFGGFGTMTADLVERDDEFVATVDLPGFERDNVEIRVTDHTLTIEAERESTAEEEDETYLRRERSHRTMRRSLQLPTDIDADGVEARMTNGVLTITLPKVASEGARTIEIE